MFDDGRFQLIVEDEPRYFRDAFRINRGEFGNAAAQHHHVRVQHVNQVGYRAPEIAEENFHECHRVRFARVIIQFDFTKSFLYAELLGVAVLQTAAADEGFHATKLAAETFRAIWINGHVSPFARDTLWPGEHLAVVDDAAAAARAQNNAKNQFFSPARAVQRFRHRKTIRVVLDFNFTAQQFFQIGLHRLAVHADRVGIF